MLQQLLDIISRNLHDASPDARRLFHGRGRTIPGLEAVTLDWYPPLLLLTLYAPVPEAWIEQFAKGLRNLFGARLDCLIVQQRPKVEPGRVLFGTVPQPCLAVENGLRYQIDPLAQQNIGLFPDMAPGRAYLRQLAAGRTILNLFAYTCGFSVAALAGGAKRVVNLDMNRRLLERGRQNHLLNGHDLRAVSFLGHDLFKSFARLRREGPFDLVILDPPYVQGSSFRAERDWPKLLRRLPELVAPGGELLAAVSAPELGLSFLQEQWTTHLPGAILLHHLTAGADFPEADPDKGLHLLHLRLPEKRPT